MEIKNNINEDVITDEKLQKYFNITTQAYELAKKSKNRTSLVKEREDFLLMIESYINDAHHFKSKNDYVNAFAALSYAHGWLDAGARLGIFDVHDSRLFTVDDD
jgi:uncharacterized protein